MITTLQISNILDSKCFVECFLSTAFNSNTFKFVFIAKLACVFFFVNLSYS